MTNRRRDYRFAFDSKHRPMIQFGRSHRGETVIGEIVDLSVSGLRVRSDALADATVDQWVVRCVLEPGLPPVEATVKRVKLDDADGAIVGFHFVPEKNAMTREKRERQLSRYLLAQQRRERESRNEKKKS